jgi:hypothetical protein
MPTRTLFTKQLKILQQKRSFYFLLAGTIIMMLAMYCSGKPLQTAETPAGIVALELAPTKAKAESILSSWKKASAANYNIVTSAKMNTWFDFIFLFFYSCFLCSCLLLLAARLHNKIGHVLKLAAPVILFAGLMDIFENAGMLLTLGGFSNDIVVGITFTCALIKWIIVLATLLLLIYASLLYIVSIKHKQP